MNFDDYCSDVYNDSMDIIRNDYAAYDNWEDLYEELFMRVTGNDNGSYYCNYYEALEAVGDIVWDESYTRSYGSLPTNKGAEVCDVIVRCNALAEMAQELKEEFEYFKMKEEGDAAVEKAYNIITLDEAYGCSFWDDELKMATIIKDGMSHNSVSVFFVPKSEEYVVSVFLSDERVELDFTNDAEVDSQDIVDAVWEILE